MGLTLIEVKFGQKLIQLKKSILNGIHFTRGPLFFCSEQMENEKRKKEKKKNDVFCTSISLLECGLPLVNHMPRNYKS